MSASEHTPSPSDACGGRLEQFFKAMTRLGASDLHLKAGRPPHFRVRGELAPANVAPLESEQILAMAHELLGPAQRDALERNGTVDLAVELPGADRFRLNVYRQRGVTSLSVRRVTRQIPGFEQLHLPPVMQSVAGEHQGLVLVSGVAGSGKSTTLAAMIEHINRTRAVHVVTLEDPIEYIYDDKKAVIDQREIGIDVPDFAEALRYLMRQDPDVVLIGEMRDRETFEAALQAAETGHLVFGTVHASSATQTVPRVLDLFPADIRPLARQALAFNLKAVICQKLLPSIKPGVHRVPACEIMLTNPSVRQLIQEQRDAELPEVIRSHQRDGMMSFTTSLLELIQSDFVDPQVAYGEAPNVGELKMLMKGISASRGGLLGR
jgi:twitching motility protein PilT